MAQIIAATVAEAERAAIAAAIAAATPPPSTAPDSLWARILSTAELADYHARTALVDRVFADWERTFYESRSPSELRELGKQAWNCCDLHAFQIAMSYLALT